MLRSPLYVRVVPARLMALSLVAGAALGAPKFPPPVKGEYTCVQLAPTLGTKLTADPDGTVVGGSTVGGMNFNFLSPQMQTQPSALNSLVLDGKGSYTVTGLRAKGTYAFDAGINRLRYTGPLAKLEQPAYEVSSKGVYSISFGVGGARNYCELKVGGNPLTLQKNPNGTLSGRLVLSNLEGTDERSVNDLTRLGGLTAPLGVRDASGRLLYTLFVGYEKSELVLEDKAGRKLGGYPFAGYSRLGVFKNWATLAPDGKRVAVYRPLGVDPEQGIYSGPNVLAVTDLNGGQTRVFSSTENVNPNGGPAAWTRDGRLLYSGKDGRLYLASADFKAEKRLTEREGRFPAVSPDGTRVAYISGNALYTVNLGGTGLRKIDQGDADIEMSSPAWSPDGTHLLSLVTQSYSTGLWLNPLEGGKKGRYLTDSYGQRVNVYGTERLSWWPGK